MHPRNTNFGLEPIKIDRNQFLHDPISKIIFAANLPATGTAAGADGTVQKSSIEYYDNVGKAQTLDIEFKPKVPDSGSGTSSNKWTMALRYSAQTNAVVGEYVLTF